MSIQEIQTKPIAGQAPGTSGLRKKVAVFKQGSYLHNFVQSIFDSLPSNEVQGCTLVVSGDGRHWNREAIQIIIKMSAANGVGRLWIGQNGLLSTPAVSAVIREREGGAAYGGIILTASHNPGGPENDFGIKYNISNGGPAPEWLTNKIYEHTQKIERYLWTELPDVDISKIGKTQLTDKFSVEVIDSTEDYVNLQKKLFDFDALRAFVSRPDFTMLYDSMHGVAGVYAHRIFVEGLGAKPSSLLNTTPSENFGGCHPDPNLVYAHELVEHMGLGEHQPSGHIPDFGAAADGDADRNMILGRRFFVTPSDSVAILAANAQCIPYFRSGLKGVSRSMPTSGALDRVAQALGLSLYEVPTGWKFFGNLMDAGKLSLCGEESFGTGSDHIREKDGMWAVLAWLSLLADRNKNVPQGQPLVSVEAIVREHWQRFGRNYYSRYDYEECDAAAAKNMMNHLIDLQKTLTPGTKMGEFTLHVADEFEYKDPVDGSVSSHQGVRYVFSDGSRFVFRLSGTGSVGATVRLYLEKYEADPSKLDMDTQVALKSLVTLALETAQLVKFTGRERPTVIT